jgi:sulfotransferase family protein
LTSLLRSLGIRPDAGHWINSRISKRLTRLRRRFDRRLATHLPAISKQIHAASYRKAEQQIVGHASRPRPIRPDFIIIGSPKCGTSWLRDALDQHQSIVTVRGETEYFSSHPYYPVEWYHEKFARRLASVEKVRGRESCVLGEKSAHYCSMPTEQIQRLHDLIPDVRLILMTRDPVARHWAHAKRYFAKRTLLNPETAVLDLPRGTLLDFFTRQRPVGDFSKIVTNWTSVFPAEQLLVVSQEKTWDTPRETFDAVLKHIGAPADYDPTEIPLLSERKNQGPKVEMPEDVTQYLDALFAAERKWLRDFFGQNPVAYASRNDHSGR